MTFLNQSRRFGIAKSSHVAYVLSTCCDAAMQCSCVPLDGILRNKVHKLPPPTCRGFSDGFKAGIAVVQVGFGDVWKQSLSELSGGQRSLLALSLILAMLLFKPAPIYILDEVCACSLLLASSSPVSNGCIIGSV